MVDSFHSDDEPYASLTDAQKQTLAAALDETIDVDVFGGDGDADPTEVDYFDTHLEIIVHDVVWPDESSVDPRLAEVETSLEWFVEQAVLDALADLPFFEVDVQPQSYRVGCQRWNPETKFYG